jgi:hypothetical protein
MGVVLGPAIVDDRSKVLLSADEIYPRCCARFAKRESDHLETYVYWSEAIGQPFADGDSLASRSTSFNETLPNR